MSHSERTFTFLRRPPLIAAALALLAAACSSDPSTNKQPRAEGQTSFLSAAPGGNSGPGRGGVLTAGAADSANGAGGSSASAPAASTSNSAGTTPRTVEETDLYRLEGDKLYYLNSYRGLMVFDVSNVDQPRFLGRSPIYGYPSEMIVRNGIATVVVSDWYGKMDDGTPFYGSIVRGIDASDPANMKILGEALLGGSVRDTRVVGDVLYAVTERYPYYYGWLNGGAVGVSVNQTQVGVSSVSFAGGKIEKKNEFNAIGSGGAFYVTRDAILLGHSLYGAPDQNGYASPTGQSALDFIDISDPAGTIVKRGSVTFNGYMQGYGTDNGRWNIDFADQKTAHALACSNTYCGDGQNLILATADFSNPEMPTLSSRVSIPGNTWSPAVRFDNNRMYLSPSNGYVYTGTGVQATTTPIQIFDLSNPAAPALQGTVDVAGQIWNFTPSGNRLFALGNSYDSGTNNYGSQVQLHYLDVSDPSSPKALGTAGFGKGWAWTPAAGTFKAFTKSDTEGLVVLPFSGWDYNSYEYNNGLQLIEFTPTTVQTSGTAHSKGWVERGIFVKNRLVSLSDLSLAVVDYTNHAAPSVVTELKLARNVVNTTPQGNGTVAELSSDFWDNDKSTSELRILDAKRVEETSSDATLSALNIPGTDARVFHNGAFSYVVTQVVRHDQCLDSAGNPLPSSNGVNSQCDYWHTRVQVVDRSTATPVLRGSVDMPESQSYYWWGWGWGWWGCGVSDWYYGSQYVQAAGSMLAMQVYEWKSNGTAEQNLVTVDFSNPDQPVMGRTSIVNDSSWWWGNLRAIGDRLYTTHYEYVEQPFYDPVAQRYNPGSVRYFLDRIDTSDPAHPLVGSRVNVPGILVGASETNPNLIYTIDYRWLGDHGVNDFAVSLLDGDKAYFQGHVELPGYVGNVFVRGDRAYFTVEQYIETGTNAGTTLRQLYQTDLSDPAHPSVAASTPKEGWGWTLDVQGDRAFVQSGWGSDGLDVYKLNGSNPPTFDQTVRVRGWYTGSLAREGNDIYLATGYWGTEHATLK